MLPEKLSTDLTSLNPDEERLAVVVEMVIGADGTLRSSDVYRARVRNHAKLAYNSVAAWLEGNGAVPEGDRGRRRTGRESAPAGPGRPKPEESAARSTGRSAWKPSRRNRSSTGDKIRELDVEEKNRAKEIIEDFMIAANGVTARYLAAKGLPSIRRVVRTPKRWDRIVELAAEHGFALPAEPDSKALEEFLVKERAADPLRFPDLSLSVIKLLGAGEYVAELPGDVAPGHFGLAVKDYAHSTAPNRRYPDLVTQRLLKAAIDGRDAPYSYAELAVLARHCHGAGGCRQQSGAAGRKVRGGAPPRIAYRSEQFDALVTGASEKGTWARLLTIPAEGRVVRGFEGVDVGDRIRVQLMAVDVERGYIDFSGPGRGGNR